MNPAGRSETGTLLRCPRCLVRFRASELRWICAPDCVLRPTGGVRDPVLGMTRAGYGGPPRRPWHACPQAICGHYLTAWTVAGCGAPLFRATEWYPDNARHAVFLEPLDRLRPLSLAFQAHLSALEKACASRGLDLCPATREGWPSFHRRFSETGFARPELDGEPLALALRRGGYPWRHVTLHSWSRRPAADPKRPPKRFCRRPEGMSLSERLGAADEIIVILNLTELAHQSSQDLRRALRSLMETVAESSASARLWLFQTDPEYALIRELGISAQACRFLRSAQASEEAQQVNLAIGEALRQYLSGLDLYPAGWDMDFDYSYQVGGPMEERRGQGLRPWAERHLGPRP